MDTVEEILSQLRESGSAAAIEGMQRFGIDTAHALGVSIPVLRGFAKKIKKDQVLSLALWKTEVHEARILASMIGDPDQVTAGQINAWVKDFNSWDLCDQVCGNLFDRTSFAVAKAKEFSQRQEEFVKRAGFVLMAEYAVHNKTAADEVFLSFLPLIEKEACDDRNFVKKAVNWALRQIGKRNGHLCKEAIGAADRILKQDSKAARWVAQNALQELKGPAPSKDPLHGLTLERIVTHLAESYGWEALGEQIQIKCFTSNPSVQSSLKFLRKTPWARTKVEDFYKYSLRKNKLK